MALTDSDGWVLVLVILMTHELRHNQSKPQ
jgi:hypothetical protein